MCTPNSYDSLILINRNKKEEDDDKLIETFRRFKKISNKHDDDEIIRPFHEHFQKRITEKEEQIDAGSKLLTYLDELLQGHEKSATVVDEIYIQKSKIENLLHNIKSNLDKLMSVLEE